MRTGPLAAAGWVVAATLTLGVSWSAMQAVRTAVAPEGLEVSATESLPPPPETGSASPSRSTSPPTPRPTAASPATATVTEVGVGGTVRVRCTGGVPELVSVYPKQGFAVDLDDSPGEVKFTSGGHRTEIKASCVRGEPVVSREEDDRGGGNSGPGGGGDNSGPGGGGG
jgi:hypothetical protein